MNEENINIGEIFEVIKKQYKIILITTAIFVGLAGIFSFFIIKPKYEAKVKLFIGKEESKDNTGYNSSEIQMYQKLLTTYAEIIKTEDLISKAAKKNNIDLTEKMDAKSILENLVVTPRNDTQILEISYKDTDKARAVSVVKGITKEFINTSKDLITNGNVKIIEEAKFPEKPVSPNKKMNMLIALVLGVMVGVGIVLLREFLDNTFKSKEDLEKVLDIPVLGAIPEYDMDEIKNHYHASKPTVTRTERKKIKEKTV
ncbi:MAG: YveK family protein [Clostridium sp.]